MREEVGIMPKKRTYQVTRKQLTSEEWEHLSKRVFPLLRELKAKARANLARREGRDERG